MDGESQERIYLSLYRVWHEAHKSQILSKIPHQDSFIQEIQALIQILKSQIAETKLAPIALIYQKTLTNLRYMAQDLLRLRKAKILELTQGHQKIEETALFPFEQEYYRQLYTAFKGYSASKKGFVQSIENNGFNGHSTFHPSQSSQSPIASEPSFSENDQEEKRPDSLEMPLNDTQTSPASLASLAPPASPTTPIADSPSMDSGPSEDQHPHQHDPPRSENPSENTPTKVKYNLFRAVKPNEVLVGEDLQCYGPLKAEDLIFLPEKNASILLEEEIIQEIKSTNQ